MFIYCHTVLPTLLSFPTRRSSDLHPVRRSARREAKEVPTGARGARPGEPRGHLARALPRDRSLDQRRRWAGTRRAGDRDRKSTRLNSSHTVISYAVFCLNKKKEQN